MGKKRKRKKEATRARELLRLAESYPQDVGAVSHDFGAVNLFLAAIAHGILALLEEID